MSADIRGLRNVSRRLVIELAAVVLLAGFPIDFPRGASSGKAWSFVFRHPSLLLHAAVGALILTEAVVFALRAVPTRRPRLQAVADVGLVGVLVAFGAGVGYVGGGQGDLALALMTVGWLAAMATYAVGWVLGRRGLRAQRRVNRSAQPRGYAPARVRR